MERERIMRFLESIFEGSRYSPVIEPLEWVSILPTLNLAFPTRYSLLHFTVLTKKGFVMSHWQKYPSILLRK